jgi:hypothetical protein
MDFPVVAKTMAFCNGEIGARVAPLQCSSKPLTRQ